MSREKKPEVLGLGEAVLTNIDPWFQSADLPW